MDPASAAISFVTAAEVLLRLCGKLRRYVKSLKVAAVETERLAKEMFDFTGLLEMVEDALSDIKGELWRTTKFVRVEKSLLNGAKELISRLTDIKRRFPLLLERGQGNWFRVWLMQNRWMMMKEDIQILQYKVQASKGNLKVLLNVVQLQYLKQMKRDTPSTDKTTEVISKLIDKITRCENRIEAEKEETRRVQAELSHYVEQHRRTQEKNSATTTAVEKTAELVSERIESMPRDVFEQPRSIRSHHSPSPSPVRRSPSPAQRSPSPVQSEHHLVVAANDLETRRDDQTSSPTSAEEYFVDDDSFRARLRRMQVPSQSEDHIIIKDHRLERRFDRMQDASTDAIEVFEQQSTDHESIDSEASDGGHQSQVRRPMPGAHELVGLRGRSKRNPPSGSENQKGRKAVTRAKD